MTKGRILTSAVLYNKELLEKTSALQYNKSMLNQATEIKTLPEKMLE